MKCFVLFVLVFGILAVGAQEMDTTYVVNEQGQTIGLIHEKGTVPVLPSHMAVSPVVSPAPNVPEPVSQKALSTPAEVDSAAYYQNLVERYTLSGEKKRRSGNGMMIGGGAGLLLGVLMMIHAGADTDRCGNDDYGCNDAEFLEFFTGYGVAIAGGAVFGVGVVLKIVGGAKLRKAERYDSELKRYTERRQSVNLRISPQFNLLTGALGSRVALEF